VLIPPDELAANVECRPSLARRSRECMHCLALLQRRELRGWGVRTRGRARGTWYDIRELRRPVGRAALSMLL